MKYLELYNKLINTRKVLKRKKGNGDYYESHHIVPKWLGGNNSVSNRVLLTAKEHYIAHLCLWKHYRDRPSALALHKMTKSSNKNQERIFTSRQFEIARKAASESQTGAKNHMFGKVGANKGKEHPSKGKKLGKRDWMTGENNPSKRDDVRKSISKALSGRSKTKQHVKKIQDAFFATPKIKCEHCEKYVDFRNFGRWHGINCRSIK